MPDRDRLGEFRQWIKSTPRSDKPDWVPDLPLNDRRPVWARQATAIREKGPEASRGHKILKPIQRLTDGLGRGIELVRVRKSSTPYGLRLISTPELYCPQRSAS